jgi:tetratricopeptide (TPR) repeat protein
MTPRVLQATMLMERGRYIEAEVLLREAITNEAPPAATTHAMLASCLRNAGLSDAANAEIKNALAIDANCAYAHYVFSFISEAPGRRTPLSYGTCIKHVERALELEPNQASYLIRLAELRQACQQWKRSLEPIEAALRLSPWHVGLAVLHAEALIHLGQRQAAHTILMRALAADPEAANVHAGMGWALLRTGDHLRATEFFEEALRLRPESGWAQRGAVECAKHHYRAYRLLTYTEQRLIHRPLLRIGIETGFCAAWLLAVFALLFWIDPIIRPHWGGGPIAAMIVPLLVIPIGLVFWREPFFSWLVRNHRSAQLSVTGPLIKKQAGKWVLGLVIGGVTLALAILLHHSKSPAVFALLGLVPGVTSLGVVVCDVPASSWRKWLMLYGVVFLIGGPILMVRLREFILESDPDPRSAMLLATPAILVALVSDRLKARNRLKEHEKAVADSQRKLILK